MSKSGCNKEEKIRAIYIRCEIKMIDRSIQTKLYLHRDDYQLQFVEQWSGSDAIHFHIMFHLFTYCRVFSI